MQRQEVTLYDPDPRRRMKHRRHGGLPKALIKKYGISKKAWSIFRGGRHRTADPSPHPSPKRHWKSSHRKYDPAPRRSFVRHAGSKVEHGINKYGSVIGGLLAAVAGIWYGMNEYAVYGNNAAQDYFNTIVGGAILDKNNVILGTRTPEISKLWGTNDFLWSSPRGTLDYVKFKFLGLDLGGTYKGSAWVIPFWTGLAAYLAGPVAKIFTHKGQRFLRPLSKIGKGAFIMSTVGALALPGSPTGVASASINAPGTQGTPYTAQSGSMLKVV